MPSSPQVRQRFSRAFVLALGLVFALFQAPGYAVVTAPDAAGLGQKLLNVVAHGTTSSTPVCSYAATDTYPGPNSSSGYAGPFSTESIGAGGNGMGPGFISMPSPPLTDASNNLTLAFRGGSWHSTSWANGTWSSSTP